MTIPRNLVDTSAQSMPTRESLVPPMIMFWSVKSSSTFEGLMIYLDTDKYKSIPLSRSQVIIRKSKQRKIKRNFDEHIRIAAKFLDKTIMKPCLVLQAIWEGRYCMYRPGASTNKIPITNYRMYFT